MPQLPPLEELTQPPAAPEVEEVLVDDQPVVPGSLQDRVHARHEELQSQRTEVLDVEGYEGIIAARYHLLGWKAIRSISRRHEKERDQALAELYTAADTLINACDELVEVKPDGTHRPLGVKWGPRAATEVFSVQNPGDTARQALLACFPNDTLLMAHFGTFMGWQQGAAPKAEEELAGESEAGSAST